MPVGEAGLALLRARALHACARSLLRVRTERELAQALCDQLAGSGAYTEACVALSSPDCGASAEAITCYAGPSEACSAAPQRYWERRGHNDVRGVVLERCEPVLDAAALSLTVPLLAGSTCAGVLSVRASAPHALATDDVSALGDLAADVSTVLARLRAGTPEPQLEISIAACSEAPGQRASAGQALTDARALRSYAERFEMAARATNDAVWDWDIAADTFWWGEGFEKLFQYRREEVEPGLASWTTRIHPAERDAVTAGIHRAVDEGETFWSAEYRFRRADGRYALVHDSGYIMRDEHGHALRMVGAMADITQYRWAERERNMEHAVARLLAELRSIDETVPRLLQTICEAMGWAYGAWWRWDASARGLLRSAWWCEFEPDFEAVDREYWTGLGPPGPDRLVRRAWLQERPTWMTDIGAARDYARSASSLKFGFQSTYAFPVLAHGERLGVIEFFGREVLEPDEALLQATAAVANQIGQYVRRRQAEEWLQESEQQLSAMFENADVGIAISALDMRYLRVNDCYCRMLGYTREELTRMRVVDVNLEENVASMITLRAQLLAGRQVSARTEKQLKRKDGSLVWVSMAVSLVRRSDGAPRYFLAICQDVSESKRAAAALAESEELFRQLAGNIPQVFWISDATLTHTLYISPACERLLGLSREAFVGDRRKLIRTVHPDDRRQVYEARRSASGGSYNQTYRIVRPDGTMRWVQDRAFPVRDPQGRIYRIAGIAEDVTDRKRAEEQLVELAHYDVVTKLPNRALLYDRLVHALAHARRSGCVLAVLFIDIDRFKHVNDTFGHAAGDQLLKRVSERLAECVRGEDTVGRLSGDEFAIVLSRLAEAEDAAVVAKKVLNAFNQPFQVEGAEVYVTVSIGITIFPADSADKDTLLRNADVAMYRAKELGRNNYQFYTPEMNRRTREMLNMEGELRRALERDELVAHYQPKVSLASGRITGVEALMRWRHPERGLVPPADFMPLLEETGLIVQAGDRILRAVCMQLRAWMHAGVRTVPVAINLSARQFAAPDLAASIGRILDEHHVGAELVELEITEGSIMANTEETVRTLERLQAMGLAIAVDDFGTGYSSLSYLKRFPLRALKIDRSFVRDMTSDPDDATITHAVISMAHSLKLKVVAEGVETPAQLALLSQYGCDEVQGYLFSRPVPGEECGAMLAEDRRLPPVA
jgi:diguanylate cyclase (GGDEF)-like protein/PAS domain S-box-containing protein